MVIWAVYSDIAPADSTLPELQIAYRQIQQ